jgi:hypothetical protein
MGQYGDPRSARGQRPATLRKVVLTALAVACLVGPAMAWTWNVGTRRILSPPTANIDSGTVVVPSAVVFNPGDSTATFPVLYTIGTFYSSTVTVTGLVHNDSVFVIFDTWVAIQRGAQTAKCSTQLAADESTANDKATRSFTVRVRDVGVDSIYAPRGIIDSGSNVTPQARVTNHGTGNAMIQAKLRIGTFYSESTIATVAPGASRTDTFPNWTPDSLGTFTVLCTLALFNGTDQVPGNNWKQDSVKVIIRNTDVGAVRFVVPGDTVDSGSVVTPQVWVRNFGLVAQSFPVRLTIGAGVTAYTDTVQVTALAAHDSLVVTFADWTVPGRNNATAKCSTLLTGDQDLSNDRAVKIVFQRIRDVGASSISAPAGTVPLDTVVTPTALLVNCGNTMDSFPVIFNIGTFYADTVRTSDTVVTFKPCTLKVAGTFSTQCSTAMNLDVIPTNDAVFDSVQVTAGGISAGDQKSGLPRTVTLRGNGPFAGRVAIEYGLPKSTAVRLEVFDACGRLVRVVASGPDQAGYHTAVWKCTDEHGRAVAEGAYFVRFVADGATLTSKVVKTE